MRKEIVKELFDIRKGKKAEEVESSDLRYIQIEDLRDNDNIKFCSPSNSNILSNQDDILIAWDGANAGTVGFGIEGVIGSTIARLRPKTDDFISDYVGLLLQSKFNFFQSTATGATIPHVSRKALENLEIPLPSLSDQQAIVAKLDRAQRLIDIDKEMLAKYDELIQSVFLEMFGDPVTNSKGWDMKRLDEFSDIQIGPFGSLLHKEDYIENGIPLVNPKNIIGSSIVPDEEKTITNKKAKELAKYILKENDIVLGRRGEMGRCAVVTAKEKGYLCGTGSILIRSELNPVLLSKILSSNSMVSHLEDIANGVTMKNLNSKIVSGIEVPIPPNEIINQYEKVINSINSEKLEQKSLSKKSEELFSSLVQGAFG